MRYLSFLMSSLIATLALTACGSVEKKPAAEPPPPVVEPPPRPPPVRAVTEVNDTIEFARDDDALRGDAQSVVANVAKTLADHPRLRLQIVGHAAPGETKGGMLSTRRAQAVRKAIEERGIDKVRLTIAGEGTREGGPGTGQAVVTFEVLPEP